MDIFRLKKPTATRSRGASTHFTPRHLGNFAVLLARLGEQSRYNPEEVGIFFAQTLKKFLYSLAKQRNTGQHNSRKLAAVSLLPVTAHLRTVHVRADAAGGGGGGGGGGAAAVVFWVSLGCARGVSGCYTRENTRCISRHHKGYQY